MCVLQKFKLQQTATVTQLRYKLTRTRQSCCLATWKVYLLMIDFMRFTFLREKINCPSLRSYHFLHSHFVKCARTYALV